MQSALVALTSLVLVGCSSAPMRVDAGNSATPSVSVIAARSGPIRFQLASPSHVAAIEVIYGHGFSVLVPRDSSGLLTTGSHSLVFLPVDSPRHPGPVVARHPNIEWSSLSYDQCPGGAAISYEPVPVNRARDSDSGVPRHEEPRLCPSPARTNSAGREPPLSHWLIVIASDEPIEIERLVSNVATLRNLRYTQEQLAHIATAAMTGHEGTWSAGAARR